MEFMFLMNLWNIRNLYNIALWCVLLICWLMLTQVDCFLSTLYSIDVLSFLFLMLRSFSESITFSLIIYLYWSTLFYQETCVSAETNFVQSSWGVLWHWKWIPPLAGGSGTRIFCSISEVGWHKLWNLYFEDLECSHSYLQWNCREKFHCK